MKRTMNSRNPSGGSHPCPHSGPDDVLPQAALQQYLLKGMAAGAGIGFLAALLFLAAAEGFGVSFTGFSSGLITFGLSGWCGMAVYFARLLRRFMTD